MNKTLLIGLVILLLVGVGVMVMNSQKNSTQTPIQNNSMQENNESTTSEETANNNTVEIKGFAFSPNTITIKVGESVTFTNKDGVGHTATADDGSFDTGMIEQNESKSITFDKAGTYTYFCTPHPNMKGTIVVE